MTEDIFLGLKFAGTLATTVSRAPWYKYKFNKYLKPKKRILVVGESGSGKSQFIECLKEKGAIVTESTMNVRIVDITLPSGRRVEFTDTPGQQTLQDQRNRAINYICGKKYNGIINFVCYGYQATADTKEDDVFQAGTTNVKPNYLEDNRRKELDQVDEWIDRIDGNSGVEWVLTIVNKADIWYDQRQDVMSYYNSLYRERLSGIKNFKQIPLIAYCCVITPFCKKPMTIAMGEKEKVAMHHNLLETLSDLLHISWE